MLQHLTRPNADLHATVSHIGRGFGLFRLACHLLLLSFHFPLAPLPQPALRKLKEMKLKSFHFFLLAILVLRESKITLLKVQWNQRAG